jgi:hypothetical protein
MSFNNRRWKVFLFFKRKNRQIWITLCCIIFITSFLLSSLKQLEKFDKEFSDIEVPSVVDNSNDRIFFHETSGRTELSFRQTCAVESAALHNPHRPVQVFIQPEPNATVNSSSTWRQVLNHYPNVRVIVIDDVGLYFKDLPVEEWYLKGEWRTSEYRIQHMSDYIRIVSLKKEGGMYLDLDVITLKPYDGPQFRNFVTGRNLQLNGVLNGVLHFDRGHRVIEKSLQLQAEEYDASDFVYNGPEALSLAMEQLCNFTRGDWLSNTCSDVHLLPHYYFFPNGDLRGHGFYQNESVVQRFMKQIREVSYGVHTFNSMTHHLTIDTSPNSTQVFALLAVEHCPISFSKFHLFSFL